MSSTETSEEEDVTDVKTIKNIRANAKRRHTNQIKRIIQSLADQETSFTVQAQQAVLKDIRLAVEGLHKRYVTAAKLEAHDDEIKWMEGVNKKFEQCEEKVAAYLVEETPKENPKEKTTGGDEALKRMLELEHELEASKLQHERMMDDLRRESVRKQEDIPKKNEEYKTPTAPVPRIDVKAFDGDPRTWPLFYSTFMATIHEANVSSSYKLLSLQDNMNQDIRRRVAHLFVPPSTYELALQELEKKYGSPEVIKQAHVQHLAAMQPVKSGDFQALFEMAAMVRDAVTSTLSFRSQQEITHSTVVLQLATKLPLDLQREWGRVAYSLRPKIATLADFDKWIDGVVGAEESRGVNIFNQNNNKPAISSRQN